VQIVLGVRIARRVEGLDLLEVGSPKMGLPKVELPELGLVGPLEVVAWVN